LKARIKRGWAYVKSLFKQGLSPHELALSIATACFWGVIPIIGIATPAVTFSAIKAKLNLPLILFVTYLLSPFHIGLFVPFVIAGEWIVGAEHVPFTFEVMRTSFQTDVLGMIQERGLQILYGLIGWLVITAPIAVLVYYTFLAFFRWRFRK